MTLNHTRQRSKTICRVPVPPSSSWRNRAGIHFSTALGRLASLLGCWLAGWAIHLGAWVRSVTYGENISSESQAGITMYNAGKALFLVCTCSIACLVAVPQVPTYLAHHSHYLAYTISTPFFLLCYDPLSLSLPLTQTWRLSLPSPSSYFSLSCIGIRFLPSFCNLAPCVIIFCKYPTSSAPLQLARPFLPAAAPASCTVSCSATRLRHLRT